jgi:hypothetical protein
VQAATIVVVALPDAAEPVPLGCFQTHQGSVRGLDVSPRRGQSPSTRCSRACSARNSFKPGSLNLAPSLSISPDPAMLGTTAQCATG